MNYSLWFYFCFHFFLFFTFFVEGGMDKFVTPIKDGDVSKRQYRG